MDRRELMVGLTAMAMGVGEAGSGAQAQSAASDAGSETVYELRIYHLNEGKQPLIVERFRTKERAIMDRCGMPAVAYWVPTDEPLAGRTFVYMLRHKSRADADANWAKAETEKDGPFVKQYDITFLKLTDFSPKI